MYRTIYENIYQRSSQTVDIWGKKKHIGNQTDMKVSVKIYRCILLNQRKM